MADGNKVFYKRSGSEAEVQMLPVHDYEPVVFNANNEAEPSERLEARGVIHGGSDTTEFGGAIVNMLLEGGSVARRVPLAAGIEHPCFVQKIFNKGTTAINLFWLI